MGSVYKRRWKDRYGNVRESVILWIKFYVNGRPVRESAETSKESVARRKLKEREGDTARGIPVNPRMDKMMCDELLETVPSDYEINGRRSLKDVRMRIRRHLLPFFGGRRATAITTDDIERFILSRRNGDASKALKPASNAEINRELAILKRAFSLALQRRKILTKPHIPTLKENNVRKGFFEREQFETIRRHLGERLQGLVTFFYVTGWRLNEVLNLTWKQVDFKAGRVYLEAGTTKNDEARVFPFTEELREVLEKQRTYTKETQKEKGVICPWVFHRKGRQVKSFRRSWLSACRKAGLPGRIVHDFRRTAIRNLVRAGVPERVAMKMTGHRTRSVFERYNIVNDADLEEAARRLNQFIAGTNPGTTAQPTIDTTPVNPLESIARP